jgi:hypothetical protein
MRLTTQRHGLLVKITSALEMFGEPVVLER